MSYTHANGFDGVLDTGAVESSKTDFSSLAYYPMIKKRRNCSSFLLKPTDSLYKDLVQTFAHAKEEEMLVTFSGSTGKFSLKNGRAHSFSVQFSGSKSNLEDVIVEQDRCFEDYGSINGKVQVAASDDVYDTTKQRLTEADQLAKEKQTKEFTNLASHAGTKTPKLKRILQKSEANAVARPITPVSSSAAQSNNRSAAHSLPSTSSAAAQTARKASPRQRLIQLLAVKAYTRCELVARLQQDGLNADQRLQMMAVLDEVAMNTPDNTKYTLKPAAFAEVDLEWPFYSRDEKERLKRSRETVADVAAATKQPSQRFQSKVKPKAETHFDDAKACSSGVAVTRSAQNSPTSSSVAISSRGRVSKSSESSPNPAIAGLAASANNSHAPVFGKPVANIPDFSEQYLPIVSIAQRQEYKQIFDKDYDEYMSCYSRISAIAQHFKELETKLSRLEPDSAEFCELEKTVYNDYSRFEKDVEVQKAKSRHTILRAKLQFIKKRVADFDASYQHEQDGHHASNSDLATF